jgi:hypothetical protein
MKDKAKAQGLTPDDARKAWSDATTKAKTVARCGARLFAE